MQPRGIVISPGFRTINAGAFTVEAGEAITVMRRCLLYWDRIEWPDNNLVSIGGGPEEDFLQSAGVLQRTRIEFRGGFSGDFTPVIAHGQLAVYQQLEKAEPGRWSLGQGSDVLRFPGQPVTERRVLEFQLYDALPTPADDVPFADILEFRQRYASELGSLRAALDGMHAEVLAAADAARMQFIVVDRLGRVLQDIEDAMHGRGFRSWRTSLSLDINGSAVIAAAVAGAAVAANLGVPIPLGAALGAVARIVKFEIKKVPTPTAAPSGPFAYLYHAKRELK